MSSAFSETEKKIVIMARCIFKSDGDSLHVALLHYLITNSVKSSFY